jgi:hypothetical protein
VHLTAIGVQPRSRRELGCVLHHSDSIANDVVSVDGLPVLAPARTVVDCLRTLDAASAVALADGALRVGAVARDTVELALNAQRRWVGRPRAMRTWALVDGRRESWLESISFVRLFEYGVELPIPQVEVFDEASRFVGRVDGLWLTDATVGEADGAGKYRKAATTADESAQAAARAVVAEARRERELTSLGLQVVRWDTDEIKSNPAKVAQRVMAERARGDIRRFTGRLRSAGVWLTLPGCPPDTR